MVSCSQNVLTALCVNGDPAWQCGGYTHIFIEYLLCLLRLTHLKDQTLAAKSTPFFTMVSLRL
jgi:hypothetical protein